VGDVATTRRDFGDGVLGRATAFLYWHLVVEPRRCLVDDDRILGRGPYGG
jgi:hypothetical protein